MPVMIGKRTAAAAIAISNTGKDGLIDNWCRS
jgi:hypothetical protein